jgi:hypothetical protein
MPFDAVCKDCWNHGESIGSVGQCRALPPDQPSPMGWIWGPPPPPSFVTVMTYRWTLDAEAACGLFKPLAEPEAPSVESRAEKIERLRREGVTDLAAFKRALEGR